MSDAAGVADPTTYAILCCTRLYRYDCLAKLHTTIQLIVLTLRASTLRERRSAGSVDLSKFAACAARAVLESGARPQSAIMR